MFGPRDRRELEIIRQLVVTSYRFAIGYVSVEDAADDVVEAHSDSEELTS